MYGDIWSILRGEAHYKTRYVRFFKGLSSIVDFMCMASNINNGGRRKNMKRRVSFFSVSFARIKRVLEGFFLYFKDCPNNRMNNTFSTPHEPLFVINIS